MLCLHETIQILNLSIDNTIVALKAKTGKSCKVIQATAMQKPMV